MKLLITTLSTLAIATTLAIAQDKPSGPPHGGQGGGPGGPGGPGGQRPPPEEIFKKLDTNNDGVLTLGEFKAGKRGQQDPTKAEAIFKEIDKNNDGKLTLDEFKAHRPQGGGPGKGGPGKGGPGKGGPGGPGKGA